MFSLGANLKVGSCCTLMTCHLPLRRGLHLLSRSLSPQPARLDGGKKRGEESHPWPLFHLLPSCSSAPPLPAAHLRRPSTKIQQWPLSARVPAPSRSLCEAFAWWFAEPGAAPSQWGGILLATMETYNMPGNRGNHRGGDKTHGNWHLSSYSFGKCDMWPSSLILLRPEKHLDYILLSGSRNQREFCIQPTFTSVAAPDTAAAAQSCAPAPQHDLSGTWALTRCESDQINLYWSSQQQTVTGNSRRKLKR